MNNHADFLYSKVEIKIINLKEKEKLLLFQIREVLMTKWAK